MNRETIRNFEGKVIGYVETEANGNKTARDFSLWILGYYDKRLNVTTDFTHKVVAKGDAVVGLVWDAEYKKQQEEQRRKNSQKK